MSEQPPFTVRLRVRGYELDLQRHVNGAVYVQYADHARFECVLAAGVSIDDMLDAGVGPVNLRTTIDYHAELRGGDDVDVTCEWGWGDGKTYRVAHRFTRGDGTLAAEVNHVSGLLDLGERRLVAEPARRWGAFARRPALLGLPGALPSGG